MNDYKNSGSVAMSPGEYFCNSAIEEFLSGRFTTIDDIRKFIDESYEYDLKDVVERDLFLKYAEKFIQAFNFKDSEYKKMYVELSHYFQEQEVIKEDVVF